MKDSVFGEINYTYGWEGETQLEFMGKEYDVYLNIEADGEEEPTDAQREEYTVFRSKWDAAMQRKTLEAILAYYNDLREELGYDVEENEDYPAVDSAEKLLEMIEPAMIEVPYDDIFEGRCVCLAFTCTWDGENGIGIRFINEEIDEIGYNDVAC